MIFFPSNIRYTDFVKTWWNLNYLIKDRVRTYIKEVLIYRCKYLTLNKPLKQIKLFYMSRSSFSQCICLHAVGPGFYSQRSQLWFTPTLSTDAVILTLRVERPPRESDFNPSPRLRTHASTGRHAWPCLPSVLIPRWHTPLVLQF